MDNDCKSGAREHPGFKTIKTQNFWDNLYEKTARKEIPFSTTFELTHRCNLKCLHCYIPLHQRCEIPPGKREELSSSEIYSILDQLADLGCFQLNLTGGEPFVRTDFFDILTYAKKRGFFTILLTNASVISSLTAQRLKDSGINKVEVSLYGITPLIYEEITQVPGSFKRCMNGIGHLHNTDIALSIKMMVLSLNKDEFEDIKMFSGKMGARFKWDYLVHPQIDGSLEPLKYLISPEEAVDMELKTLSSSKPDNTHSKSDKISPQKKKALFQCNAGINSLAITPDGKMNICLQYRLPQYDVRKEGLAQQWKNFVDYVKSLGPDSTYQCTNCDFKKNCFWCPAVGLLEEKNASTCSSYYRQLARIKTENWF
ncbi:MAG: radical SAM protein [Candidatus Aminicenantes bacterium]|nr:radical SAM protein [Candidatus Aminicenantes bacterium]